MTATGQFFREELDDARSCGACVIALTSPSGLFRLIFPDGDSYARWASRCKGEPSFVKRISSLTRASDALPKVPPV